jgi:para-aminobenzoate synthetase component 1
MLYEQILNSPVVLPLALPQLSFTSMFGKEDYITTIEILRDHIREGDCYEVNFCSKGYSENVYLQPLNMFNALNSLSPAPFAAYYRLNGHYMACASPERYLKKIGSKILSQPIKGTARRSKDPAADNEIRELLRNDLKERAENVMIVDLVRNDLARSCEVGSITVDELFGIYTYPQVHQMISTVSGLLTPGVPFTEAIQHSFPMGSMTGAPKYKVMQLIEQYERAQRELFSGSVGYITPEGDFDFNVIIRSLFYNADTHYLSYQTGGAITYDSVPEQEWEEMRLKAWALERIFQ